MCVLHWLQSHKPLSVFVTNRLKEIKSLKGKIFKHVSSEDNPADLATRGKYPKELTSSIWWMGPAWLGYPQDKWLISKIPECKTADGESEMKGIMCCLKLVFSLGRISLEKYQNC